MFVLQIQDQLDLLQQFVLEGICIASATRNADLTSLYESMGLDMQVQLKRKKEKEKKKKFNFKELQVRGVMFFSSSVGSDCRCAWSERDFENNISACEAELFSSISDQKSRKSAKGNKRLFLSCCRRAANVGTEQNVKKKKKKRKKKRRDNCVLL
jgi:hypothetical protein